MEFWWVEDTNYENCWDLYKDSKKFGFVIDEDGVPCWYEYLSGVRIRFPGKTTDEVKAVAEALVILEG